MQGAESHCHLAAGCTVPVWVGRPWTICFANEGSHPERTSISGNCFFFYITTCWRVYFLLFPFCWFHCLLMDSEFLSWFWSRTSSVESTAVFRWGKARGQMRWAARPDTWSGKKIKQTLQNGCKSKLYFSFLKNCKTERLGFILPFHRSRANTAGHNDVARVTRMESR